MNTSVYIYKPIFRAVLHLQDCKIARLQDSPKNGLIYKELINTSVYIYKPIYRAVLHLQDCKNKVQEQIGVLTALVSIVRRCGLLILKRDAKLGS